MQTRAPVVIGRDHEVTELDRALGDARRGRGRAVFLVGEAGIGKSRLARVVAGRAFDEGMQVLRGRGTTIGPMVPFRPIAEALLALFRGGEPPDDAALGPYKPVLGRLIPEWSPDSSNERQAGESLVVLAEAVLRLLAVVGRKNPCVLVLEDLHDADAETLAVIEYLVDNLDHQPVLLLATIRSEPGNALDVIRLAAQREAGVLLELNRLSRAEVGRMATACLETGQVPDVVTERLWSDSAGNPFVVEELLHGMVSSGMLVRGADGWQVLGELRVEVPAALVRSIAHRTDRLGPQGRELLSIAAVLGHRFSLSVMQKVTGMDDRSLLSHLHAGVAAQLVTPDQPAPDWYAFRHPLTAEALLAQLTPTDRAELSRRTAEAIEALHPGLPGDWCPLVASLRLDAGDSAAAGKLLAEAGRRALSNGAAGSAANLLDQANRLLASQVDVDIRAEVLESLLPALSEAGQFERAFSLADTISELSTAGLDRSRRASLHTGLARVASLAGRWAAGTAQIDLARSLLGPGAGDEQTAQVDVVSAFLTLNTPSPDRISAAAVLARRAADAASHASLPAVGCEAWQLLGIIARENDLGEANECFDRARRLAEEHNLPIQRIYALIRAAGNDWLSHGTTTSLEHARDEALRVGAITVAYNVDAIVALNSVLCGDYALACRQIDRCLEATNRLQLGGLTRYLLMCRATLAAHQGKRHDMEAAVTAFLDGARGGAQEIPLCYGLARAFCALLEENRDLAESELAKALAYEAENPTTFHLSGKHGLHLLLGVLAGRAGWPHYREISATSPSGMRWNNHFGTLAHAVLLGRDGRATEAMDAVRSAQEVAAPYPMARFLGLRLVAEAAHADGWGDPVGWLRAAEEHFHRAQVSGVASACRGLLRQVGVSVQQRRTGSDQVPRELRAHGVTVREFEVFVLLADRMGNKAIATRLHISPRTVEKHVASLITKTKRPDREALSAYAQVMR